MIAPEFSRLLKLDEIGSRTEKHMISAKAGERQALARRFGLLALDRLDADLSVRREGDVVAVSGRLRAMLAQPCVATGESVPAKIDEVLAVRFIPSAASQTPDTEVELSDEDCDVIEHDGLTVDLGEAAAQSLFLVLDPYPRRPDADALLRAAGVKSEGEVGAFSGLFALRDKLSKGPG